MAVRFFIIIVYKGFRLMPCANTKSLYIVALKAVFRPVVSRQLIYNNKSKMNKIINYDE